MNRCKIEKDIKGWILESDDDDIGSTVSVIQCLDDELCGDNNCDHCPLNKLILELLELRGKQMPKKIQSDSCCKNVCPSCGEAVHKALSTEVYCQYCGQLIDWERN